MSTVTPDINYEASTRSTSSNIGNGCDYRSSSENYEQKTEKKLSQSDTLILAGFGSGLSVRRDALAVKQGFTHSSQTTPQTTLF